MCVCVVHVWGLMCVCVWCVCVCVCVCGGCVGVRVCVCVAGVCLSLVELGIPPPFWVVHVQCFLWQVVRAFPGRSESGSHFEEAQILCFAGLRFGCPRLCGSRLPGSARRPQRLGHSFAKTPGNHHRIGVQGTSANGRCYFKRLQAIIGCMNTCTHHLPTGAVF